MSIDKISKYGYKFHKILGVLFFVVGGLFLYVSIGTLIDPEATIMVNGEETNNIMPKILLTLFSSVFFIIGLFFTFITKEKYERIFIKNNKLLQKVFGKGENV